MNSLRNKWIMLWAAFLLGGGLFVTNSPARGQQWKSATPDSATADSSAQEILSLIQSVQVLQNRVDTLTAKLSEVESNEDRDRVEIEQFRRTSKASIEQASLLSSNEPSHLVEALPAALETSTSPPATPQESLETRVEQLEEGAALGEARLKEQSQTKVESGSKYRLRLSGIVLVNFFDNRGAVDNQDFPEVATQKQAIDSPGSFGGSLRQSQVSLDGFGPTLYGAHTSANLTFDFAAGFPSAPNSVSMGIVRLRTGSVRFDWGKTSVTLGQDSLFFAPLSPTSLGSLAAPAFSYSGNLWSWSPQLRVEHQITLSDNSSLLLQAGILDSLSGEAARSSYARSPTWGEESGAPAVAFRTAWNQRVFGQSMVFGAAGYYGRQYWGFGRDLDAWVGLVDWSIPISHFFELSGDFYRGRALGGLGGAIGQDLLLTGPFTNAATQIYGLDSMGGWAQFKVLPNEKFQVNGALGLDSPFAGELRRFPASELFYRNSVLYSSYGALLSRNLTPLINFIYQPKSDVSFSVEYRRILTSELDSTAYSANHVSLNVGYTF
jgi:hypothetical protein